MLHIKLPSSITKVTPLLNKALVGVGCGVAVGFGVGVGVMVSPLIDAVYPLHKSGVGCGVAVGAGVCVGTAVGTGVGVKHKTLTSKSTKQGLFGVGCGIQFPL